METSDSFNDYLSSASKHYTNTEIARHLDYSERQIRRWRIGESTPPKYVVERLKQLQMFQACEIKRDAAESEEFAFIDLFAGIGGMRLGFEANGGRCVFTSEWDRFCQRTYIENHMDDHSINGDIRTIEAAEVPEHDVLLAGFPCQPFSIAGVSKKNSLGRVHGFLCETQGTLFFDVARIIAAKQPKAFLLENVKNLLSHDKGNTFKVILNVLRDELGYDVHWKVIDAKHFLPQHRERIIIVGFREKTTWDWETMSLPEKGTQKLSSILHGPMCPTINEHDIEKGYLVDGKVNPKYTLSDKLWNYLQQYAEGHRLKGNGFGFGLVGPDDTARTLSARYYKDGSEILVEQGPKLNPRRLTPRECARLMGFDDTFRIPVSDTQAYKQFGNSVAVPVITEIARVMKPHLLSQPNQLGLPLQQYA